jgi:two-component system sensor histidine kinase HydH
MLDTERLGRWPLQWLGLAAGAALGATDALLTIAVGVEMTIAGRDAALPVLAFVGVTYAGLGFLVGRLIQEHLRVRAASQTIERQLRELEAAQRELVEREKLAAIGRLAAGIAHEVRNPLAVIRASASMVRESFQPGEDAYRACEFVCEESDRLNGLITALLAFARPTEPRRERVALPDLIERACELADADLTARHIEIVREITPGVPAVYGDPDLIAQLIYGLIGNAGEALGEGGQVAVRLVRDEGCARLEVADDGPGVPPEAESRIFEPFFTTKATGTGLGLPMAQRIAEAHGGRIAAPRGHGAGANGAGACFRLDLPIESPLRSAA